MSAFNLLHPNHLMLGVDPHDVIMPPEPLKIPAVPHFVIAVLRGGFHVSPPAFGSKVKHAPKVQVLFADALQRATDIGVMVDHVQYNLLLFLIWADSKSKSSFGAGTVRAQGRPVATAIHETSTVNLNCGDPVRLMSGMVLAPSTVRAGMTVGDMMAGFAEVLFDTGLSLLKSQLFSALVLPGMSRILGKNFETFLKNNPELNAALEKALKVAYGKLLDPVKAPSDIFEGIADELNNNPEHRVFL